MHPTTTAITFFHELELRMQPLSKPLDLNLKRDGGLVVCAGIGLLLAWIPWQDIVDPVLGLGLTFTGLVMELSGAILLARRQVADIAPDFVDANQKFALDMDQHFTEREAVVAWLASLPPDFRRARLIYIQGRLASLRSRYTSVFGAVEKLGVLPVLVGVFFQIRSITSLSPAAQIVGATIVTMYFMSFWFARFRTQLEAYERLLDAADAAPCGKTAKCIDQAAMQATT